MSRIAIIGSGVVGQATGNGLEKSGHSVVFLDIDPEVLKSLKNNSYEVAELSQLEKINYGTSILCLPTPSRNGIVDLTYIDKVLPSIGKKLSCDNNYHLVVIRSTL